MGAVFSSVDVHEDDPVQEVDVTELRPNPYQPRKQFHSEAMEELAASIKEHGIVQPLVVRNSIRGYEIVAGERRYRAAQMVGLPTVPVVIRQFTDAQMMEIALIENLQREN